MSFSNTSLFDPSKFSSQPLPRNDATFGNRMAIQTFAALSGSTYHADVGVNGVARLACDPPGPDCRYLMVFATWGEMDAAKKDPAFLTSLASANIIYGYLKAYEFMQTPANANSLPFYILGKPQSLKRVEGAIRVTLE